MKTKTYSYLKDNNDEGKKAKGTVQIENKINHLDKK